MNAQMVNYNAIKPTIMAAAMWQGTVLSCRFHVKAGIVGEGVVAP